MSTQTTTPADPEHEHYEWGASAAKQWRGCPGSIAFTREKREEGLIPDDNGTEWSREGTEAHDYADKVLKGTITPKDVPPTIWEHLSGYVDLARELAESNGGEVFNEQQIPLFYNREKTGTLDYAVASDDEVAILDLKYGVGIKVTAADNEQLAIYALSLMENLLRDGYAFTDTTNVRMHIYQPRHRDFDGLPEVWETTYRDLKDFGIDIEDDYKRSKLAKPTDLNPSKDACQFCDARRCCAKRVVIMFEDMPEGINPIAGEVDIEAARVLITDAVRVRVFQKHKEISKFFEDLVEDTTLLIEQGKLVIPELKVVDGGKGNRQWGDNEDEADKLLRKIPAAERYKPKKLISPAQAEKLLKKLGTPIEKQSTRFQNRWRQLVFQKGGSPVLALATDPRPARTSVMDGFADVSGEVDASDCL